MLILINKATFEEKKHKKYWGEKSIEYYYKKHFSSPSSIWDPLLGEGFIIVPSTLGITSDVEHSVHMGNIVGSSIQ